MILGAVACSGIVVGQRHWVDDAFISFRYAANLLGGHGLVYNPGEPVEGYTNFLWTLLASLGLSLGFEPIHFAQGLSLVAQATTLWLVFRIGRTLGNGRAALLGVLFLAAQPAFLVYPMTGMETSFFTMLVTLAVHLVSLESRPSRTRTALIGASLAGLLLTRFDGFVLVGVLACFPRRWPAVRRLIPAFAGVTLVFLAYNAWRVTVYPTWLPNTFYAKTSFSAQRLIEGVGYLRIFVGDHLETALALAGAGVLMRRHDHKVQLMAWVVAAQAGYVALVGGDWMVLHRFALPVLPLLSVLVLEGLAGIRRRLEGAPAAARLAAGVVLLACYGYALLPVASVLGPNRAPARFFHAEDARRIGESLRGWLAADEVIAVEWGGIIPYYAGHPALELFGLTDTQITRSGLPVTRWGRRLDADYLARRAPGLIVPCARVFDSAQQARRSVESGGDCDYRYYPRMATPERGYRLEIVPIGSQGYWPALVRRGPEN